MCNLYSINTNVEAIRRLVGDFNRHTSIGNFPPLPGVFPDYAAPVLRNTPAGRELALVRWGLPSPAKFLEGKRTDPGVTNVRNVSSPHWRRWLSPANRCVVPFTSFSEFDNRLHLTTGKKRGDTWFALGADRPLAFFAGIWTPNWTSTRKLKEGEVTTDLFAFLTTSPNAEVAAVHPKAMPVILTTPGEVATWLEAPWAEPQALQRPLPDDSLKLVAVGMKQDLPAEV